MAGGTQYVKLKVGNPHNFEVHLRARLAVARSCHPGHGSPAPLRTRLTIAALLKQIRTPSRRAMWC